MGEFLLYPIAMQDKENQTLVLVIPGPQIACQTQSGQADAKFREDGPQSKWFQGPKMHVELSQVRQVLSSRKIDHKVTDSKIQNCMLNSIQVKQMLSLRKMDIKATDS